MVAIATHAQDPGDLQGFQLGEVIDGRYELRRLLGSGAEGVVFEALHRFTNQRVAIKLLSSTPSVEQARQRRARMLREALVLGQVRHPNIVTIFDARVGGDPSYVVLEYLDGRTLEGLLAARGTLSPADAVSVALQACEALAHAHRRHVVHRDLKPSNILVASDPAVGESVKLVDFGASLVAQNAEQAKLTAVGALVGTPSYMAPEQLLAEDEVDHRVDVYAMGAVLFECITGRLVRPGNYSQILKSVYTEPPPSIRERAPHVSPALARVIQRAISTNRAERQASVAQLADELRSACPEAPARTVLLGSRRDDTRRRVRRAHYSSPVRVVTAGGRVIDGRSQDVSEGGMLFQATHACPRGEMVTVRFGLPVDGKVVCCAAQVRWVGGEGHHTQVMGLEFTDLPAAALESIQRYVGLMSSESKTGVERAPELGTLADTPSGRRIKAAMNPSGVYDHALRSR